LKKINNDLRAGKGGVFKMRQNSENKKWSLGGAWENEKKKL
jgi:hypothetical protein